MKKYELTSESVEFHGKTLYRIRALRDFGDVEAGDLGGFIENERNLSHEGNCWVYNEAKVFGYAQVRDNAQVRGFANVYNYAVVRDNAQVSDFANVYNRAVVRDNATIIDHAVVKSYSKVCGETILS